MTPPPACFALGYRAIVAAALLTAASAAMTGPASGQDSQCRAIQDPTARLHCYERLLQSSPDGPAAAPPMNAPSTTQRIGKWQLIRTSNPQGGKDAVSIIRTAEPSGSDPDFAGLMIRCGDSGIEVLAVVIGPQSLRTHPNVSIDGTSFESSVVPPGSTLLLPPQAAELARTRWPSLAKLSVDIELNGSAVKGVVALDGLAPALAALDVACSTRR